MVTIPNGDYSSNKVIISKVEPEMPEASEFASQLDLMQIFTENIVNTNLDGNSNNENLLNNPGLLANAGGSSSFIHICTLTNEDGNLSGYTRLGISAEFQSLLNNSDVVKGNYGLKFYIHSTLPSAPGQAEKSGLYEYSLSANDMTGNPYKFGAFSKQEKVLDISMIKNIVKIEVFFFQDGDFKDSTDNLIQWQYINNILGLDSITNLPNNLYVQNLEMYLGYSAGEYQNDRMVINCDSIYYTYTDYNYETGTGPAKKLNLQWIHKFDNGVYKRVDMISLRELGITLNWYRYNLNAKNVDEFAGRGWEKLPININDTFRCNFVPDRNLAEERIKVIGYKVNVTYESSEKLLDNPVYLAAWQNMMDNRIPVEEGGPSDEEFYAQLENLKYQYLNKIESSDIYESDELILKNTVQVYDSTTFNATSALSIYYEDGSEGNYFIYDTNGRIINQGQGHGYERRMRAVYNGKDITPDLGTLDYIAWYLPIGVNSKTMLLETPNYYTKDNGQLTRNADNYSGVQYLCIRRYQDPSDKTLNTCQSYSINSSWNNSYTNNLVRCEVSINGVKYTASNTMQFGKAGTQGTNTTLILDMVNNHNAVTVPVPVDNKGKATEYIVVATVYDVNGNKLDVNAGEWSWSWKTPMTKLPNGTEIIQFESISALEPNKVKLIVNISSLNQVANGYYGIIQATFEQIDATTITSYLSIPLKASGYSHIEGATEITYNSSGSPQYYSDAYKLFMENENDTTDNPFLEIETSDLDWNVVHSIDLYKTVNGQKVMNQNTGEYEVSAMAADYIPKLKPLFRYNSNKSLVKYQGLCAAPFYATGYNEICITCTTKSGEVAWVQPLLITSSNYDYSVLNDWDGGLTTDEGTGTIMSTLIGAGRKNEDNTFSGILMGDVKNTEDTSVDSYVYKGLLTETEFNKDTYYEKLSNGSFGPASGYDNKTEYYLLRAATGIYGFQNGTISFSLKDNGVATFGKSGRGQIIIDGNESTLTSQGYKINGNGMLMDLDDGKLTIKDNDVSRFLLSPQEPYLVINGVSDNHHMIYIGNEECYLQSQTRSVGSLGTKLDLVQGILDIQGTGGNVYISGREVDPFFKVTTRTGAELIHMDVDKYYLQSAYFAGEGETRKTSDNFKYELYKEREYMKVALNPNIAGTEASLKDGSAWRYYTLDSKGEYVALKTPLTHENFKSSDVYYRKGNQSIIYAYNPNTYDIYFTEYDSTLNGYKVSALLDIWETDVNGEYIHPILQRIDRYEAQPQYNSVGFLSEEDFNPTIHYKLNEETEEYELVSNYIDGIEYFIYEIFYGAIYVVPSNLTENSNYSSLMVASFISSLEAVKSTAPPSGMKLNLVDGCIEGYNLKLVGTKLNEKGEVKNRLIINTDDDEIPFQIGNNLKAHWDGELECTKVSTIAYTATIPASPISKKGVYTVEDNSGYTFVIAKNITKDNFGNDVYYYLNEDGEYTIANSYVEDTIYYLRCIEQILNTINFVDGTWTGNAATATTAATANNATYATTAGTLEDFNNKIHGYVNGKYLKVEDAEEAYGPYKNRAESLDYRITRLENNSDNWDSGFNDLSSGKYLTKNKALEAFGPIENISSSLNDRIVVLEDFKTSIDSINYQQQINTLLDRIKILEEQLGITPSV